MGGLQEIRHRLKAQSGLFVWLPSLSRSAIDVQTGKAQLVAEYLMAVNELASQINQSRAADGSVCILVPIHSESQHYTLLVILQAKQMQPVTVQYFETLFPENIVSRQHADQCLEFVCKALEVSTCQLPVRCNIRKQTDGWSCGLWVLVYAEIAIRRLVLRQPRRATPSTVELAISRLNVWCQLMQKLQHARNPPKPSSPNELPPVPPPLSDPPPLPPPAVSPPAGTAPTGPEIDRQRWGCSRCRHSSGGCISCNPGKAETYMQRKGRKTHSSDTTSNR